MSEEKADKKPATEAAIHRGERVVLMWTEEEILADALPPKSDTVLEAFLSIAVNCPGATWPAFPAHLAHRLMPGLFPEMPHHSEKSPAVERLIHGNR